MVKGIPTQPEFLSVERHQKREMEDAVPGQGYSSPVISGDQIWMTSAENGKSLHAICLDLATGNLLHNIEVITTNEPVTPSAQRLRLAYPGIR